MPSKMQYMYIDGEILNIVAFIWKFCFYIFHSHFAWEALKKKQNGRTNWFLNLVLYLWIYWFHTGGRSSIYLLYYQISNSNCLNEHWFEKTFRIYFTTDLPFRYTFSIAINCTITAIFWIICNVFRFSFIHNWNIIVLYVVCYLAMCAYRIHSL